MREEEQVKGLVVGVGEEEVIKDSTTCDRHLLS